jgi:hypothetical protein
MDDEYGTHGIEEICFWWGKDKERRRLEEVDVDGRIVLN